MKQFRRIVVFCVAISSLISITGCGGGGSSGAPVEAPVNTTPGVQCDVSVDIPKTSPESVRSTFSSKIVGGTLASIEEWPDIAAIVRRGVDLYRGQFCGGTLIDPEWVLTALSCRRRLRCGLGNERPDDR